MTSGQYEDMMGIRLYLPAGIDSKNAADKIECSIIDGNLFQCKALLPSGVLDSPLYYAPHQKAAKQKIRQAEDDSHFDKFLNVSKHMDEWMEAEQEQVNENSANRRET